jgi:hypothetical protein
LIVQGIDGCERFSLDWHFHKSESARPARLTVGDHTGTGYDTEGFECGLEFRIRHLIGEVADVEIHLISLTVLIAMARFLRSQFHGGKPDFQDVFFNTSGRDYAKP